MIVRRLLAVSREFEPDLRGGEARVLAPVSSAVRPCRSAGQSTYDEAVTQTEHALQCAALAEAAGFGLHAQVAALLHDIGHLVLGEDGDRPSRTSATRSSGPAS
jgi:predicted HD phosphohydrolase